MDEQLHRPLLWRHNERRGVSNNQPHDCLLSRFFWHRWKKASKLRVTGLCEGNSPGTGEFPAQRAINAENISIWWRHHDKAMTAMDYHVLVSINPLWSSDAIQQHRSGSTLTLAHVIDCCQVAPNHYPNQSDLSSLRFSDINLREQTYQPLITKICLKIHHSDVIMSTMASQITSPTIVNSTVCSGADERTHISSASLAFVRGIHQWPVNSLHKGPVTRKIFPFDDIIMLRIKNLIRNS